MCVDRIVLVGAEHDTIFSSWTSWLLWRVFFCCFFGSCKGGKEGLRSKWRCRSIECVGIDVCEVDCSLCVGGEKGS